MNSILISSDKPIDLKTIREKLSQSYTTYLAAIGPRSPDDFVVECERGHVYVLRDFDADNPSCAILIDYVKRDFANEVLVQCAGDPVYLVTNAFGLAVRGDMFVKRIQNGEDLLLWDPAHKPPTND